MDFHCYCDVLLGLSKLPNGTLIISIVQSFVNIYFDWIDIIDNLYLNFAQTELGLQNCLHAWNKENVYEHKYNNMNYSQTAYITFLRFYPIFKSAYFDIVMFMLYTCWAWSSGPWMVYVDPHPYWSVAIVIHNLSTTLGDTLTWCRKITWYFLCVRWNNVKYCYFFSSVFSYFFQIF